MEALSPFIRGERGSGDQVVANIYVISREGGEPRLITTPEDKDQLASMDWSPDGKTIALEATKGGEHELWLMEDFRSIASSGN